MPAIRFALTEAEPEETRPLLLGFPYVCPEPVLVKRSFIYINGSKRPFLLTDRYELALEVESGVRRDGIARAFDTVTPARMSTAVQTMS
jgi:hypothetical protein